MGSNLAMKVPVTFGWKIDKHAVIQFEAVHLTAAKFGRGAEEKKTNKKLVILSLHLRKASWQN